MVVEVLAISVTVLAILLSLDDGPLQTLYKWLFSIGGIAFVVIAGRALPFIQKEDLATGVASDTLADVHGEASETWMQERVADDLQKAMRHSRAIVLKDAPRFREFLVTATLFLLGIVVIALLQVWGVG